MARTSTPTPAPARLRDLMTVTEVAQALRVDPKTVTRWAKAGRLNATVTPGGHRRFYRDEIAAVVSGDVIPATRPAPTPKTAVTKAPARRTTRARKA